MVVDKPKNPVGRPSGLAKAAKGSRKIQSFFKRVPSTAGESTVPLTLDNVVNAVVTVRPLPRCPRASVPRPTLPAALRLNPHDE